LAALGAVPSTGEATHRAEARISHLARALEAVRKSSPEALDHANEYARVLDQGACSSSIERLKVECLMTASRRYCGSKSREDAPRCNLTMDVAVSNVLAAHRLITDDKRYEIMKRFKDPRRELAREMRRIQGSLAVDFRLRMGEAPNDEVLA